MRTALTLIGVVVGTLALALSLAVGRGVDRAIVKLFHEDDRLRKVTVNPKFEETAEDVPADRREPRGSMGDAKRARIRKALVRSWNGPRHWRIKLTSDALRKLSSLEHVSAVVPEIRTLGKAVLDDKIGGDVHLVGAAGLRLLPRSADCGAAVPSR